MFNELEKAKPVQVSQTDRETRVLTVESMLWEGVTSERCVAFATQEWGIADSTARSYLREARKNREESIAHKRDQLAALEFVSQADRLESRLKSLERREWQRTVALRNRLLESEQITEEEAEYIEAYLSPGEEKNYMDLLAAKRSLFGITSGFKPSQETNASEADPWANIDPKTIAEGL
jgi:hypothetical protein